MYSQDDYNAICRLQRKRWLIALIPAVILFLGACGVFVAYRLAHDIGGWIWSGLLTILGGGVLWFLYNAYIRPVKAYRVHVGYMLSGPFREAEGVVTALDDAPCDKDGVTCRRLTINVGDRQAPDDDRLYYWDVLLGAFPCAVGERVHIKSNDKMISDLKAA